LLHIKIKNKIIYKNITCYIFDIKNLCKLDLEGCIYWFGTILIKYFNIRIIKNNVKKDIKLINNIIQI